MAWIRTIEKAEAVGRLREVYEELDRLGIDPKSSRVLSLIPDLLWSIELFKLKMREGTPKVDRRRVELIAVVTSALNRCTY